MTTQKSFTTEIEWFDPFEKTPKDMERVLIISKRTSKKIFSVRFEKYLRGLHLWIDSPTLSFKTFDVKYWAYLPTFPEVE